MARSINEIQQKQIEAISNDPILSPAFPVSQASKLENLSYNFASSITEFEQLLDLLKEEYLELARSGIVGTGAYWRKKMFEFQFGDVLKEVSELNFQYEQIDTNKRIITRCSVENITTDAGYNVCQIKVAKGNTPQTLTALNEEEFSAAQDYVNDLSVLGSRIIFTSLFADRLQVNVNVYYKGQFVLSSVKSNVKAAIENYCYNLNFNNELLLSKLQDAIQAVEGVSDVELITVKGRESSKTAAEATTITRKYRTSAGYIFPEDENGYTLDDTINMILDNGNI